ncbi:hypothetical protein Dimus_008736, partial [Dionaea muscipula]
QWHWEYATNGNEFMLQNGCCRIHVVGDGTLQSSCCRMGVATKSTNITKGLLIAIWQEY